MFKIYLHIDNGVVNRCKMLCGVYHRSIFNNDCLGVCVDSNKKNLNDDDWTTLG